MKHIVQIVYLGLALVFATNVIAQPINLEGSESSVIPAKCQGEQAQIYTTVISQVVGDSMQAEFSNYLSLIEQNLALRSRAIEFFQEVNANRSTQTTLTGDQLKKIREGQTSLISLREKLLGIANKYECAAYVPLATTPEAAWVQAKAVAMALSSVLVLYDNYIAAISSYRADFRLRHVMNRADRGFELPSHELAHSMKLFASPVNRARVRHALAWHKNYIEKNSEVDLWPQDYRYMATLIDQSPARQVVRRYRPFEFTGNMLDHFLRSGFDGIVRLVHGASYATSFTFGNVIGLVESRRGKLYNDMEVHNRLLEKLQPGDILLEKTPFRLTDSFIPGHWGHVAIWAGKEDELRALGIWDHPKIIPYQKALQAGRSVVEALRSGVKINSLAQFVNVDDLVILRQRDISQEERKQVVLQAFRQIGKPYDFNFDVETTSSIVCSELVYHTYTHLKWPTARMLGRATISPDNVAVLALPDGNMDIIELYRDGQRQEGHLVRIMDELLNHHNPLKN